MALQLLVRSAEQIAILLDADQRPVKRYRISTARNGLGCVNGSGCTPYGRLRVARKIGADVPIGTVFRDRMPTGEIWCGHPDNPLFMTTDDLLLTRLLVLEGDEACNRNTIERGIYLSGTNREGLLGTPDSQGSVRFSNQDILEIFELLQPGALVEVL